MKKFDAIVIGAGQAGVPLAKKLALAGWKTLLIEKRMVGGTCINDGCTPTKTMIASARMAYLAGNSKSLGVEIPDYRVNFEAVMSRKNAVVKQFREGAIKGLAQTANLTLVYGEAKFTDDHTVKVTPAEGETESYTAGTIFVNTGASSVIPDIEGVRDISYLTSTTILELDEIPEHLLIVGGGYIGLEFGQMFRRFGSRVTILEHGERLMPREDEDVCEVVSDFFKAEDISVITAATVLKFRQTGGGEITVTLEQQGKQTEIRCTHVLLASGRKPQTGALGLEHTGVECDDHGHINVNEFLQTTVPHIYALGDVKGGPAFTHISYNDHIVLTKNLLEGGHASISGRMVPYCMFTDPQVGRIGITETEAEEQGLDYLVAKLPMKNVSRAIETGETQGFMKAVVDKASGQILGATIIGEQGGEIMTILQMAMMGKITYEQVRYAIFAHPLYAESLNNLFMSIT